MKYIEIRSSTWAGTQTSERISLEEFGFDESATEDTICNDEDALLDIQYVAEQQQHFEWNFRIVEDD